MGQYYSSYTKPVNTGINLPGIQIDNNGIKVFGIVVDDDGVKMPGISINDNGIVMGGMKIDEDGISITSDDTKIPAKKISKGYSKMITSCGDKKVKIEIKDNIIYINDEKTPIPYDGNLNYKSTSSYFTGATSCYLNEYNIAVMLAKK